MRHVQKMLIMLLIVAVFSSALYISADAGNLAYGAATVDATSLNLRSGPGTTYPVVATASSSERLVILDRTNNEWYRVVSCGTEGYVASMYLRDVLTAENFEAVGKLTGDDVFWRTTPSTSGRALGTFSRDTTLHIIGINNGWYKIRHNGSAGYIRSDFITLTGGAADAAAMSGSSSGSQSGAASAPPLSSESQSLCQQLVSFALKYVGYNYVYGGSSPSSGFDCSGFVYYIYRQFDQSMTRTATSQFKQSGTSVSKSELAPGDLVFFSSNGGYSITHVGIYIGNNEFVHASTPKVGVVVSSLDSSYYTNVWYGARRILS